MKEVTDNELRRIDSLLPFFTDIYDNGVEVNPMPDNVKLTVWCSNGRVEDEGFAVDVFSNELGIEALIAKKWILQADLDGLLNHPNQ